MKNKRIKKYLIITESEDVKNKIEGYDIMPGDYCEELEFDTLEEAKVEFEKNYKNKGKYTQSFCGSELVINALYEENIIVDENGDVVDSDINELEF